MQQVMTSNRMLFTQSLMKISQLQMSNLKVFYCGKVGRAGMDKNRHEAGSGFWGLHPFGSTELKSDV
jgi:hypothetical protein